MVEENVWIDRKCVRPRLSLDELWLIYRLVNNQCVYACTDFPMQYSLFNLEKLTDSFGSPPCFYGIS